MNSLNAAKRQRTPLEKLLLLLAGLTGLLFVFWFIGSLFSPGNSIPKTVVTKAVVVLSGSSTVNGTVTFEQATPGGPVTITGDLHGLDPSSLRGFHIHQSGDLTNGCLSTGPHYNPFGKTHGAPDSADRHVGDLGNIKTDENGAARFTIKDSQIFLNGPLSIVGRAVVVHAGTDDLGKGGNEESLKTGNAGGRAACGVIGIIS